MSLSEPANFDAESPLFVSQDSTEQDATVIKEVSAGSSPVNDTQLPEITSEAPHIRPLHGLNIATHADEVIRPSKRRKLQNVEVRIPACSLLTPPSHYMVPLNPESDDPSFGRPSSVPEPRALYQLLASSTSPEPQQPGWHELILDDFTIYSEKKALHGAEMCCVHLISTVDNISFYADGVLRNNRGDQARVFKVTCNGLSVGNYGIEDHAVDGEWWIRSAYNASREQPIYYKLGRPGHQYRRWYTASKWVVELGKHVVDYLAESGDVISIHDFRCSFSTFLLNHHQKSLSFQRWYGRSIPPGNVGDLLEVHDFRRAVAANSGYLWKEAYNILGKASFKHPLWKQTGSGSMPDFIPLETAHMRLFQNEFPLTVCTDFVFDQFSHLPLRDMLKFVPLCNEAQERREPLLLKFQPLVTRHVTPMPGPIGEEGLRASIKPGMVIAMLPSSEHDSYWNNELAMEVTEHSSRFGIVQAVHQNSGQGYVDVIWMYRPSDTPCALIKYPYANELFVSDNCTCCNPVSEKVRLEDVGSVHLVEWGGDPETKAQFFARQVYHSEHKRWERLENKHLQCNHTIPYVFPYDPGDTVLVKISKLERRLEPCEVLGFDAESNRVHVRLFERLSEKNPLPCSVPPVVAPNELVYSDQEFHIKPKCIAHRCLVRFVKQGCQVPPPYDRDGAGNLFFFRRDATLNFLEACPSSLRQGFDPATKIPVLRGLDLFCGSGNFGRGIQEAGAVQYKWCNDMWTMAVHTYMANVLPDEKVGMYHGACDFLLHDAMRGRYRHNVPAPGDVDYISGASPCQGFSLLSSDQPDHQQRKNQSLIVSYCSFVDFYLPAFGLIEDVSEVGEDVDDCNDVFPQMVCSIVSMGYQVQVISLETHESGAPQRRRRLILLFARPDVVLPPRPERSHFDPQETLHGTRRRAGVLANGYSIDTTTGQDGAAFYARTFFDVTADLPPIYDGKVEACVTQPDHLCCRTVTSLSQHQWDTTPHQKTYYGHNAQPGSMTPDQHGFFPSDRQAQVLRNSRSLGLIHQSKPLYTVPPVSEPADTSRDHLLHWEEPRPITILEAKRAQGFRDSDVILGTRRQQWKLVSNSIPGQVAVTLGLAIRDAWLASSVEGYVSVPGLVNMESPVSEDVLDSHNPANQKDRDAARVSAQDNHFAHEDDEQDKGSDISLGLCYANGRAIVVADEEDAVRTSSRLTVTTGSKRRSHPRKQRVVIELPGLKRSSESGVQF